MRSRYRSPMGSVRLGLAAAVLSLLVGAAEAAELRRAHHVVVPANETIRNDLYVYGETVDIRGAVEGDVIACAGTTTVSGTINGSLLSVARTTHVNGKVQGTVRAIGEDVVVAGEITRDLVTGSRTLTLGSNGCVNRDVLAGAAMVTLGGPVGNNVLIGAAEAMLDAPIGGDVRTEVRQLRLGDGARIDGRLVYASQNELERAPGATVKGPIERSIPRGAGRADYRGADRAASRGGRFVPVAWSWLRSLVGLFALGLLLLLPFRDFDRRALGVLTRSPWTSAGLGIVVLVVVPLLAMSVFIAGLLIGGWWLALAALAAYGVAVALGFVFTGAFLGEWLFARLKRPAIHPVWSLLLGLVVLTLIARVPYVGVLVALVAVILGLGALALAAFRAPRAPAASVAT